MTTIEPPKMTPAREAYLERKRQKDREKSRAAYNRKKERRQMQTEIVANTPAKKFVRKHCTWSNYQRLSYAKDPEETSTDIGGYGVVLGSGNEIAGTAHTGLPINAPKPATVYDGCGNDIATKWQRPITY